MEHIENGGTAETMMILTDHAIIRSAEQYIEITFRRKKLAQAEAKRRSQLSREKVAPIKKP